MSHPLNFRVPILPVCVAVALLVATSAASAQASGATATGSSAAKSATSVSAADKAFVQKATMGGIAEVEMGKLAQQKAASDQVKQFGSRMVADHSKANDELRDLAAKKGGKALSSGRKM